jgi:hypothetical protein
VTWRFLSETGWYLVSDFSSCQAMFSRKEVVAVFVVIALLILLSWALEG